ncbi:MAG: DUF4332 domain-containing protein [Anaerolineales bacterium]|nr:DUF4332 domain-containing protein [Anaerolineales bacterium]
MYSIILFSEENTGQNLVWWLAAALAFFFLMSLIGWWVSRKEGVGTEVGKTVADDLTKIEGIGPKVKKILNSAGITTFADLAKAKAKDIDKLLDAEGLQMMDSIEWIQQAKLAAKGDWNALQKLQDGLKGGRRA